MLRNGNKLDVYADAIEDRERSVAHIDDQREALVENYIKGQKLAITLGKNNLEMGQRKALFRLMSKALDEGFAEKEDLLKQNVDVITGLKERLRKLETDNDSLANENEELRQFSLDGYEIAKNVQQLSGERERLSVDLADKAKTIRTLLDENEILTKRLKMAHGEASNMMRVTGKKRDTMALHQLEHV